MLGVCVCVSVCLCVAPLLPYLHGTCARDLLPTLWVRICWLGYNPTRAGPHCSQGPGDPDEERAQQSGGLVEPRSPHVRHAHGSGGSRTRHTDQPRVIACSLTVFEIAFFFLASLLSHRSQVKTEKRRLIKSWSASWTCHPTSHRKREISSNG